MTALSFETVVPVRYQDFDALGHVNNAVYATYLEEARTAFVADELGLSTQDISMVVAHLELDFDAPIVDASEVTIGVAPTKIGEKSFTLTYEIETGGRVVSRGETVQVWITEDGNATPIPDEVRGTLTPLIHGSPTTGD